jgi:P27 family predicted phage terminase small subunit
VRDVFPDRVGHVAQQSRIARLRRDAKKEWQRIVASLDPQGLLASVDESVLLDHCTAVAVARECYRDIALNGYSNRTERGVAKNPATTVLAQQRDRLKYTVAQLGASPLARDALSPRRSLDDEDSPFD